MNVFFINAEQLHGSAYSLQLGGSRLNPPFLRHVPATTQVFEIASIIQIGVNMARQNTCLLKIGVGAPKCQLHL